jgi:hypothetical protein
MAYSCLTEEQAMPDQTGERREDPGQLPVYKHLSTLLLLLGIGGILVRRSHTVIGVLVLLWAPLFLVLAVRSVLVRRRQ